MNWLEACKEFGAAEGIDSAVHDVLSAFPPKAEAGGLREVTSFVALEKQVPQLLKEINQRLQAHLAAEIDGEQASMFARRSLALQIILDELSPKDPGARVLRAGFAARLAEIVESSPSALRVRAIIDFYYSQAGIRHHRMLSSSAEALPTLRGLVEQTQWRKVQRGLFHRAITGMTQKGPVNLNALRFDRGRFSFEALDFRDDVATGSTFAKTLERSAAVAGFSGGFFLYSEPDIDPPALRHDPVGLLVSNGNILNPPVYSRPAFIQDKEGRVHIATIGLKGVTLCWPGGIHFRIGATNAARRTAAMPVAFNRAQSSGTPHHQGYLLTIVAGRLTAFQRGGRVRIPVGGFTVTLPATPQWDELASGFAVGTEVSYELPSLPGIKGIASAIAGGPTLLEGGRTGGPKVLLREEFSGEAEPMTFSTDETGDLNLLPRLAIGLTPDHAVVVLAADGRNFNAALGLTLADTTAAMRALGCLHALNMDGGSSKRLVLGETPLDLPTTEIVAGAHVEESVRPVHNGFVVRALDEATQGTVLR